MNKQTRRRSGKVKITSQGQVSIPRHLMREAGLQPGDVVQAQLNEEGNLIFVPAGGLVERFAGVVDGYFAEGELDRMRDEWDNDERDVTKAS